MTTCPACRFVHTSTDTLTVGRFNPGGPRGYRARSGGPLRETRAEAERDECQSRQGGATGSMRPRLLDLFCCQGGAAMGYHRAGFDVTGVDIVPQPRYPFEFIQADALEYLAEHGSEYDAIHASPPCQDHSTLRSRTADHGTGHLLGDTLKALDALPLPYVVENVAGAKMPTDLMLCGSMFGLAAACRDGVKRQLRRHRRFALSVPVAQPACVHDGQPVGVYGTGGGGQQTRGYRAHPGEDAEAMGIDWMTGYGLSQSIPPAFTEYIGGALLSASLERAS